MTPDQLRMCRSILFLPASNERAIAKARTLEADLVVLDLEDAVKPEDKSRARSMAIEAVSEGMRTTYLLIRTNKVDSEWYGEDIVAIRHSKPDAIIIPKVEIARQLHDAESLVGKPALAMIETARGVMNAGEIAPIASALVVGTNDLSASLRIPPGSGRAGLAHALQATVLAARAAGVAVFDGVYNRLDDPDGLERECREGRAFGFDGKSLIHPGQIEVANRVFSPSVEEVAAAERLVAAASGGAERFEGRMIEALHVAEAREVLAKARRG
jgi:(3S)-malyl-CoA thioesterase